MSECHPDCQFSKLNIGKIFSPRGPSFGGGAVGRKGERTKNEAPHHLSNSIGDEGLHNPGKLRAALGQGSRLTGLGRSA